MAAGFACLNEVAQPGVHETLDELTTRLAEGLREAAEEAGIPLVVNHVGGMFGIFFTDAESVTCYQDVMACDVERFNGTAYCADDGLSTDDATHRNFGAGGWDGL